MSTKIIFTVDVEGKKGVCELPDQLNLTIKKTKCGINYILEVADRYQLKMTFFVDVYQIRKPFGVQPVKTLTKHIFKKGHDVQLHTHPGPFFEYKRNKMFQFSADEQYKIIEQGVKLVNKWIGYYPEAHRAGAYAANKDTISALGALGFKLDSSYFLGHRNCKLTGAFPYENALYKMGGILELPVTTYELFEFPRTFSSWFQPIISQKKVDIDASTIDELKSAIIKALEKRYQTVTVFMHSFSFVKNRRSPNYKNIKKLEVLLEWIKRNRLATATAKELTETEWEMGEAGHKEEILKVSKQISILKYIVDRISAWKKSRWD